MNKTLRIVGSFAVAVVTAGLVLASDDGAKAPSSRLRPGLTAQQTKQAVTLTKDAMRELRKKTEGASKEGADLREFVVGVELLKAPDTEKKSDKDSGSAKDGDADRPKSDANEPENEKANDADSGKDKQADGKKARDPGPLAVVTWYRYFDDITVFSTVDLGTGKLVKVEAAQHLRTALSEDEFDLATLLAREKSDEVKKLYDRFGKELSVYPQFSQFTRDDDPRINRVVHLTYRVGKRDLSWPRPQVNLTTRDVDTPAPEEAEDAPKEKRPK
jgi:hypothetical protein